MRGAWSGGVSTTLRISEIKAKEKIKTLSKQTNKYSKGRFRYGRFTATEKAISQNPTELHKRLCIPIRERKEREASLVGFTIYMGKQRHENSAEEAQGRRDLPPVLRFILSV
jgi:hypothetical protein